MTALTEETTWESEIFQIEIDTVVLGGVDGIANRQAKQLANRTKWLKNIIGNQEAIIINTDDDYILSVAEANSAIIGIVSVAFTQEHNIWIPLGVSQHSFKVANLTGHPIRFIMDGATTGIWVADAQVRTIAVSADPFTIGNPLALYSMEDTQPYLATVNFTDDADERLYDWARLARHIVATDTNSFLMEDHHIYYSQVGETFVGSKIGVHTISNETNFTITFSIQSGADTGVKLNPGQSALVYYDNQINQLAPVVANKSPCNMRRLTANASSLLSDGNNGRVLIETAGVEYKILSSGVNYWQAGDEIKVINRSSGSVTIVPDIDVDFDLTGGTEIELAAKGDAATFLCVEARPYGIDIWMVTGGTVI